jgi:hypothetical protein
MVTSQNLLAVFFIVFGCIRAAEKFSIKQLNCYHSKYELEQGVHDHDVQHILDGVNNAIKDCLQEEVEMAWT